MGRIKRVLWIDDNLKNPANRLFIKEETKMVSSMQDALLEIAGEHLYEYDTIVLDIDFENGVNDPKKIVEILSKKLYLSKKHREDKKFLEENGGYLLFLYLLEKGYPSEQIAFLTGNPGIIGQLQNYHKIDLAQMSPEDISEAFQKTWEETVLSLKDEEYDFEDLFDIFERKVFDLPIADDYKDYDLMQDCALYLENGEIEEMVDLIQGVKVELVTGNLENTGDKMIFRFHESNLEPPIYFSKNENDIKGHNKEDANRWLEKNRTKERVSRWLILSAGDYIERCFVDDQTGMTRQMEQVLRNISGDGGIRSAFRQMFFVFDGLRNYENRGIYYQAISAMLIPFDASPQYGGDNVNENLEKSLKLRRMSACCAKQARNYCAHNYFGTTLSNKTTLFLLMVSVTAVLNKNQKMELQNWYKNIYQEIKQMLNVEKAEVDIIVAHDKIDDLVRRMVSGGVLNLDKANVDSNYEEYTPRNILYALGYNQEMGRESERNTERREQYFLFTLAVYIVKWFDKMTKEEVRTQYGEEIYFLYETALLLVLEYNYPKSLPC